MTTETATPEPPTPATPSADRPAADLPVITLRPRHARPIFSRHPWVYVSAITDPPAGLAVGDEVVVATDHGQPIARGLWNPNSLIRVRLYSWDLGQGVDAGLIRRRVAAAVALRKKTLGRTDACRLVFSEADGLSGLTVDAFGGWLVVQITSAALFERGEAITEALRDELSPRGIVLRTERGLRELEGLDAEDGVVWGQPPPAGLTVDCGGVSFRVDLSEGQKTGFYFDQRANRAAVARYCAGASVLDCHAYSGGFALAAAKLGGAAKVVGVDTSAAAVELAAANAELNGVADRVAFKKSDAAAELNNAAERGERFGVVVLDPPKLARTRGGLKRALKAYTKLNAAALRAVEPGGVLATCSCSGLVTSDEFDAVIREAALEAGRFVRVLESRHADVDHPRSAFCPETDYLKCRIAAVE